MYNVVSCSASLWQSKNKTKQKLIPHIRLAKIQLKTRMYHILLFLEKPLKMVVSNFNKQTTTNSPRKIVARKADVRIGMKHNNLRAEIF